MLVNVTPTLYRDVVGTLWKFFIARWTTARAKAKYRQEYAKLLHADVRILKDVGLTKEQVVFDLHHRRFGLSRRTKRGC